MLTDLQPCRFLHCVLHRQERVQTDQVLTLDFSGILENHDQLHPVFADQIYAARLHHIECVNISKVFAEHYHKLQKVFEYENNSLAPT